MKKVFLLFASMVVTVNSFAQYNVGDLTEIEGVPSVIVKIDDEGGEHGIAMTFKHAKFFTDVMESLGVTEEMIIQNPLKYAMKLNSKAAKTLSTFEKGVSSHYVEVVPAISGSGEDNVEAIKKYCEEKSLNMEEIFPDQAWAAGLGEGWFVPGDDEIAFYADLISPGLNIKTPESIYNKTLELQEKSNAIDGFGLIFPSGICQVYTSSISLSSKKVCRHFLTMNYTTGLKLMWFISIESKISMGTQLVNCPMFAACYKF